MADYTADLDRILKTVTELLRKFDAQNAEDHMAINQRLDHIARRQEEILALLEKVRPAPASAAEVEGHDGRGIWQ